MTDLHAECAKLAAHALSQTTMDQQRRTALINGLTAHLEHSAYFWLAIALTDEERAK